MKSTMKLKEIIVIAMISALIGVVFTGLDSFYGPLQALAGPVGGDIIYGLYLISALIGMYIVRKPGAGIMGSLFTGLVNLLMGSPYGIHIIVAALLQGAGVELVMATGRYKKFNFISMGSAAVLAMLLVTTRDYFMFGFGLYANLVPIMLAVRIVSSLIFGAGLTMVLGQGIKKTGAVSGFNIAVRSDY